jgi:hypothetical protein
VIRHIKMAAMNNGARHNHSVRIVDRWIAIVIGSVMVPAVGSVVMASHP